MPPQLLELAHVLEASSYLFFGTADSRSDPAPPVAESEPARIRSGGRPQMGLPLSAEGARSVRFGRWEPCTSGSAGHGDAPSLAAITVILDGDNPLGYWRAAAGLAQRKVTRARCGGWAAHAASTRRRRVSSAAPGS